MRKYFQITLVLGVFAAAVFLRQIRGDEAEQIGNVKGFTPESQQFPTQTPAPSQASSSPSNATVQTSSTSPIPRGRYKDGVFTGSTEDVYYGNIQVRATISGGRITDVEFLQYPNDNRTSIFINSQAMPMLRSEAISAQSANVDIISGASDSSAGFQRSLQNSLDQAKT